MAGGESCFEPSGVVRPERSRQPEAGQGRPFVGLFCLVRPEPTFWLSPVFSEGVSVFQGRSVVEQNAGPGP